MTKEERNQEIVRIKDYAKKESIPIMNDEGIEFLTSFIEKKGAKDILEIGTAIGYSAIMMALVNSNIHVTTIERDEARYLEALKNIKALDLENRITLIYNDALNVELDGDYDIIFIDAAKGKNQEFFNHFEKNLREDGFIITDNMGFHGYVEMNEEEIPSKNIRGIVKKIKNYIYFLENHMQYKTTIYKIGDGIAVTERR
jgi:predicted O-methyltransferase YrrM